MDLRPMTDAEIAERLDLDAVAKHLESEQVPGAARGPGAPK